ncbi:MAG: hypothetical protein ACP5PX_07400 [Candidatus Hadarchaeum sp.]|uniref:hypothetical protein n=1 Tax=Candidatus Hadarchaeum sp. TaxID=2883567 RepID=UPI003D13EB8F
MRAATAVTCVTLLFGSSVAGVTPMAQNAIHSKKRGCFVFWPLETVPYRDPSRPEVKTRLVSATAFLYGGDGSKKSIPVDPRGRGVCLNYEDIADLASGVLAVWVAEERLAGAIWWTNAEEREELWLEARRDLEPTAKWVDMNEAIGLAVVYRDYRGPLGSEKERELLLSILKRMDATGARELPDPFWDPNQPGAPPSPDLWDRSTLVSWLCESQPRILIDPVFVPSANWPRVVQLKPDVPKVFVLPLTGPPFPVCEGERLCGELLGIRLVSEEPSSGCTGSVIPIELLRREKARLLLVCISSSPWCAPVFEDDDGWRDGDQYTIYFPEWAIID